MIGMGLFEMVVSQIPNIGKVWGLSVMASVMSFGFASIWAGLALWLLSPVNFIANDLKSQFVLALKCMSTRVVATTSKDEIWAGHGKRTTLTGIEVGPGLTAAQKMWRMFRAFGDMLICCSYSAVLIEIQV